MNKDQEPMSVDELLDAAELVVASIFRRIDCVVSDPEQAAACKRLVCSWMTGGCDLFKEVVGPDVLQLLDIEAYPWTPTTAVWQVFEGSQYDTAMSTDVHIQYLIPVLTAKMLHCLVGILRENERVSAVKYDGFKYHGCPTLSDEAALAVANHIRAKAGLRPRTMCLRNEVLNYAPVVRRVENERRVATLEPLGLPADIMRATLI
jgi:hypothetical protein